MEDPPDSQSHPQDPRFEGTSHYDRDEICKVVLDFYKFLVTMPPFKENDLLIPPKAGWPSVTPERLEKLSKNATVIDLLKHLPCLNMDRRNNDWISTRYHYIHQTEPLDYRGRMFEEARQADFDPFDAPEYVPFHGPFPAWVAAILSCPHSNGECGLLDTTDGTITRKFNAKYAYTPSYAKDDPRSWRDGCELETYPAAAYFERWKRCFEESSWLPCWERGSFELVHHNEGEVYEQVHEIYHKHGWPSEFRRDGCGRELREWDEAKHPDYYE